VQRVQAGHDEVQGEEKLRVVRVGVLTGMSGDGYFFETERGAWDVMLVEFVFVLDAFDAEENKAEKDCENEAADEHRAAGGLRGPDG